MSLTYRPGFKNLKLAELMWDYVQVLGLQSITALYNNNNNIYLLRLIITTKSFCCNMVTPYICTILGR